MKLKLWLLCLVLHVTVLTVIHTTINIDGDDIVSTTCSTIHEGVILDDKLSMDYHDINHACKKSYFVEYFELMQFVFR